MRIWSLGQEDPLEKNMATHCSILAWSIPWTEEPGGLQYIALQRVGHDWSILPHTHKIIVLFFFFFFFPPLRLSSRFQALECLFGWQQPQWVFCHLSLVLLVMFFKFQVQLCYSTSYLPSPEPSSSEFCQLQVLQGFSVKSFCISHMHKNRATEARNKSWEHVKSSVYFSCSVMSKSLQPQGLQHSRPPCPSPTPGVYSNSCPLSRWCHPTISSSVIPFSLLQSYPASGSFPMS